jgi:HTH-type transcriptional regulator, transcriptional repressor of NAD biosynthesis genes
MTVRGLVIGKFYPPHRGHKLLIDTALAQSDELHVIVCDKPGQEPPANLRAGWIREIHPAARVHLIDDRDDPDDSAIWAANCRRLLGFTPDVVFTSENYGDPFAACLGCRHVLVDRARAAVPISGTAVRADPRANWDYLEPPVRGYYARRVVLIGAESTGKTTLTQALAAAFGPAWVPEYGRLYWEAKMARGAPNVWQSEEFATIAELQCAAEDAAARVCERVLFCDTDAFATRVWHHRYMNSWSAAVDAIVARHRVPDLYLLTDLATPFVQDGTRDGEHIREWMHATFEAELRRTGRRFVAISGPPEARLAAACAAVQNGLG